MKSIKRGDIYLADLNPTVGSEQAGFRPVIVFQNDEINKYSRTIIIIPVTTQLERAKLPSCIFINKQNTGLNEDSVALCHQIRAIDKVVLFTTGIFI